MALPKFYSGGTASVASGSTAVTGDGTAWVGNVAAGDYFRAQGLAVRIASVDGNGGLTLAEAWPGETLVDAAYEIGFTTDAVALTGATRELRLLLEGDGLVNELAGTAGGEVFKAETPGDVQAAAELVPGTDVQAQNETLQEIADGTRTVGDMQAEFYDPNGVDGRAMFYHEDIQLFGANSRPRTFPARFSDTIDLREFLDPSGAVGTDATNNAGLNALISYMAANPEKRTLVGKKGDVYKIGGHNQWVWPAGIRLKMEGARFQWFTATNLESSPAFVFSQGSDVEALEFEILDGALFRRLMQFGDNSKVSDLFVYAETQISNEGSSPLLDYAIRIYGENNIHFRRAKVKNIDKVYNVYGNSSDKSPLSGVRLEGMEAEN